MQAVIIKYTPYAEYEAHPKFSMEIAFAGCNMVLETLSEITEVEKISLVVPDQEYEAACRYVPRMENSVYKLSDCCGKLAALKKENSVLFIDEQACLADSALIGKVMELARHEACAVWSDPDKLLASFGYAHRLYFFTAPGVYVRDLLPEQRYFDIMLNKIRDRADCASYPVTPQDIPAIYERYIQINPLPYHFVIEATSRCDSKCIMCPFHSSDPQIAEGKVYVGSKGTDMPLEKFRSLVDEITGIPWTCLPPLRPKLMVTPQMRGEPLLAPDFMDMCRYVKEKGLGLSFSSNGNNLHRNNMTDFFLDIGLDEILISIDADEETFLKVRPQLDYANIMRNISTLYAKREARGLSAPRIYTKNIILRDSQLTSMERTAEFLADVCDMSGFCHENFPDYQCGTVGYTKYMFDVDPGGRVPCLALADTTSVFAEGNVKMCFGDINATLGNVHSQTLLSILSGSEFRKKLLRNNATGIFDSTISCKTCSSWFSQYNRVRTVGDYNVYENPILSYWEKRRQPA